MRAPPGPRHLSTSSRWPSLWPLIASLGDANAQSVDNTQIMLDGLSSGRFVFAYDLIGSYALRWAQRHPEVVVVVPRDYALVLSRMVFVHKGARHIQAAARFVDFLLSHAGQQILAHDTPLFSLREDVSGPYSARQLRAEVGDHLYPIPIDAGLLAIADPQARGDFLARWQREFSTHENAGTKAGVESPHSGSAADQNGISSSRSSSKPGSPAGG